MAAYGIVSIEPLCSATWWLVSVTFQFSALLLLILQKYINKNCILPKYCQSQKNFIILQFVKVNVMFDFLAWKYVKLMEVTVSPDPDDPHMGGSVALVKDG